MKLSISKKLILSFGSIALLSALFGIYSFMNQAENANKVTSFDKINDETILAAEVRYHSLNIWQYVTDASLTLEENSIKEAALNRNKAIEQLDRWIELNPLKKDQLEKLKNNIGNFYKAGIEMYDAYKIDTNLGREKMISVDNMGKEISEQINKSVEELGALSTSTMEEMVNISTETKSVTIIVIIICTIFTLGVTFVSIRNITQPLKTLTDAAKRFGNGDISVQVKV